MAILMVFLLIPIASAGTIACDWFHTNCPANSINVTNSTSIGTTTIPQNTTITEKGKVIQTYAQNGQYVFSVTLPKSNVTTGIYGFAVLGLYGTRQVYQDSVLTNCTTTNKITCTTTFVLDIGTYTALEVTNNGNWIYALKLPATITTTNTKPIITTNKGTDNTVGIVIALVAVSAVLIAGSMVAYSIYMQKKHPEDLYK